MKTLVLAAILIPTISANGQNVPTRKEIYRVNCKAVVQVYTGGRFSGTGFIVSNDGVIFTANHVVTTRESKFKKYETDIKVLVNGKTSPYTARPFSAMVSDDQANFDSAVLKIEASDLPHVTLGNWSDVDIGDSIIVISSFPGMGCIMLEGMLSNKSEFVIGFGPKPVNGLLFQAPVRNGVSGSPVFDSHGRVVGIEDTKVFGISVALDNLRTEWASDSTGNIAFGNFDLRSSFVELINNLDQNLISGLGSGVDIGYAKREQQAADDHKK